MNFNGSKPDPVEPPVKKNNHFGIILAVVLGSIAATVIVFAVMSAQDQMDKVFFPSSSEPTTTGTGIDTNALQQKLYDKCKNLEDWYRSLEGFENTNYHCDQYAKAWSGLAK